MEIINQEGVEKFDPCQEGVESDQEERYTQGKALYEVQMGI